MDRLPYIDEYAREIAASPEAVWHALLATLAHFPKPPRWLITAWGLTPSARSDGWDRTVVVGDTVPGFAASAVSAPHLLTLRGGHRFSDYELQFELQQLSPARTRLRATTSAVFPGLTGRMYRALVIGTGGHRIAVARTLASVGRRAERRA